MNGIRPNEILDIQRAVEEHSASGGGGALVLATVISLDGSVYSRAGAMALFAAGAEPDAGIPARSAQEDLHQFIEETASSRTPRLAALRLDEDDPILGYGFLSPGRVELLLEPVDEMLREHLRRVREVLLSGEGLVCAVELEDPALGRRSLYAADHPLARECYREMSPELVESASEGRTRRVFLCPVHPMGKVLILGSGPDAAYLAAALCDLGFTVFVADPRPGRLRHLNWSRHRAALIEGGWEELRVQAKPDADTSVVVMMHGFAADLEALKGALQSPAPYVGVAGSAKSSEALLAELARLGIRRGAGELCAPAGLDIGSETPQETALAIAAEILAARSGRKGGRRPARGRQPEAAPGVKGRVPGLILAAGRGRRFTGGNKLSAPFEGLPVLRHVVLNALASRLDPVIVVLGCDAEAGLKALSGIDDPKLRVVFNPAWESGKASSIEVGLRQAPAGVHGVVSLLGDMPLVKPWLIDRIIQEFELTGKLTFPVYPGLEGPRKGYPTAFPRRLFAEIRTLTGDETAMAAVREHWSEAVKIPLEDAATQFDVDTAEDLQLFLAQTAQ